MQLARTTAHRTRSADLGIALKPNHEDDSTSRQLEADRFIGAAVVRVNSDPSGTSRTMEVASHRQRELSSRRITAVARPSVAAITANDSHAAMQLTCLAVRSGAQPVQIEDPSRAYCIDISASTHFAMMCASHGTTTGREKKFAIDIRNLSPFVPDTTPKAGAAIRQCWLGRRNAAMFSMFHHASDSDLFHLRLTFPRRWACAQGPSTQSAITASKRRNVAQATQAHSSCDLRRLQQRRGFR